MLHNYLAVCRCLAVVCICILTGCSSGLTPTTTGAPADIITNSDITLAEYRIGVSDRILVNVWRNPDLTTQVVVLPDGNISVPLVGDLRASGRTTTSLAESITEALNEFIREPEVTVSVTSAASAEYLQRVRITGAVNLPISMIYSRGLTILDVVLAAGGLSPYANGNKAALYRKSGEEVSVFRLKLDDILAKGLLETNYLVLPSDVISVPEKSF